MSDCVKSILKLAAALAAVAAAAVIICKLWDKITGKAKALKEKCPCCCGGEDAVEEAPQDEAPVEEAPYAEAPADETPVEEAEKAAQAVEDVPDVTEADFAD